MKKYLYERSIFALKKFHLKLLNDLAYDIVKKRSNKPEKIIQIFQNLQKISVFDPSNQFLKFINFFTYAYAFTQFIFVPFKIAFQYTLS